MLSLVAILTLALSPADLGGFEPVRALERLPVPAAALPMGVRLLPLEQAVVLTPAKGAPALAKALRALSPAICPRVQERGGEVRLQCRTTRLGATLVSQAHGASLELRELAGLPVGGEAGFPVPTFDPAELGLGPCPGETPASRGECLLAAGDLAEARRAFAQAEGDEARGLAALRLGDLALLAGNVQGAENLWRQATLGHYQRLAGARRCEIGDCVTTDAGEALFAAEAVPLPFSLDLQVRGARVAAYRGRLLEAATRLRSSPYVCDAAPILCSRVLLSALRAGPQAADGAVALYLAIPDRNACPLSLELALAAARATEAASPVFAASLLATATKRIPPRDLPEHLLHTAELYVAGGDLVRAEAILEFARTHEKKKALPGARWAAVTAAVKAGASASAPPPPAEPPPELAAAAAALQRARAIGAPRP